jgi:hypothetical protein
MPQEGKKKPSVARTYSPSTTAPYANVGKATKR